MFLICNRICFCRALLALTWVHKSPDDSHWRLSGIKYDWMPSFYGVYHVFVWYVFCYRAPKIWFGTRTHKQIAQITRELAKTVYSHSRCSIFIFIVSLFLRCANISQRSSLLRRSTLPSLLNPRFSVLSRAESWRLITVWSAVVLVGDNWAFIGAMFSQCLWCSLSATYHCCS